MADLTQPAAIHWVDGSQQEYDWLCDEWSSGTFTRSIRKVAGMLLCPLRPRDVARVEDRTFICSLSKDNAGPTNNWDRPLRDAPQAQGTVQRLHARPHHVRAALQHGAGRLAHVAHRRAAHRFPYVVVNMRIMARIGLPVFAEIDKDEKRVVPCMHSVGMPLAEGQKDVPWPCNDTKYIVHFPERARSGAMARATAATRCWARNASRCASLPTSRATKAGWPSTCSSSAWSRPGREDLRGRRVSFSACGKTNFAMMIPPAGLQGLEGLDRRRRHCLDQARRHTASCAPSIPRRDSSASRRAPATRPIPTPWPRWPATPSLPMSRSRPTAACGGRA
jgi:phosphoenolpyruvate carboxykinase (GTP)